MAAGGRPAGRRFGRAAVRQGNWGSGFGLRAPGGQGTSQGCRVLARVEVGTSFGRDEKKNIVEVVFNVGLVIYSKG